MRRIFIFDIFIIVVVVEQKTNRIQRQEAADHTHKINV